MSESRHITLTHPVFGQLCWGDEQNCWVGRFADASGDFFDLDISAKNLDPIAMIEPAADLFQQAFRAEMLIRRAVVERYLLNLYIDWRVRSGDPELTAEEVARRMQPSIISLIPGADEPIEFWYHGGGLFSGYGILVRVASDLRVVAVELTE